MKWPVWIPYPGQWLRALVMMVATIPIILLTKILSSWVMLNAINDAHPASIALLICWFFFSLIGLTAWGHHKLFGPDDRKRITRSSWWAATFAVLAPTIAMLIAAFVSLFLGWSTQKFEQDGWIFYFPALAEFCQKEFLARQRLTRKHESQADSKPLR